MTARVAAALAFLLAVGTASGAAWGSDVTLDRPAVALGGGSLLGTVAAAETEQPLAGVCVAAEANGGSYRTTTGADGRWVLTDLPAGAAFLSFNDCENPVSGHAATWWPSVTSPQDAHALAVERGLVRDQLDVTLGPAAVVTGRVLDEAFDPVAGACVLALADDGAPVGRTRARADGGYTLSALPPGELSVEARDCAAPATRTPATVDITARRNAVVTAPDLALGRGGAVTGVVTALHTGAQVAGACVTLWTAEPDIGASLYRGARTSGVDPLGRPLAEAGRFVFDGIEPGAYRVFFGFDLCSAEDGYAEEWFDGLHGPAMYEPGATTEVLQVLAGAVISGIGAALQPAPATSVVCPWPPETGFPDTDSDAPHGDAIACATAFGVVSGRTDGTFAPAQPVTRGQAATMLTRAMAVIGAPLLPAPPDAFDDDEDSPHQTALDQLAALHVLHGVGPRRADPGAPITRGQLATIIVRAYTATTGVTLVRGPNRWTDDDGSVHEAALDSAALAGLISGTTPTTVDPQLAIRRGQLATIVTRFMDRVLRDTTRR